MSADRFSSRAEAFELRDEAARLAGGTLRVDTVRDDNCIEALEAQPAANVETTYLVEKIRVRITQELKDSNSCQAIAEAVLREVAEWLRSELNSKNTADRLEYEANR